MNALPAETRVHAHHEDQIDAARARTRWIGRGVRVQDDARFFAERTNLLERSSEVEAMARRER